MPTPTPPARRRRRLLPARPADAVAAAIAAGAAYAAAELALGLAAGFFALGRAEALLFLAVRPWLLILLALLVAPRPGAARAAAYGAALALAAGSQTILLLVLGAPSPWAEALNGLLGGAALLAALDIVFHNLAPSFGRRGRPVAAAALAMLFVTPWGLMPYEAIVLRAPAPPSPVARPAVTVMTGLPLVWGEGGAFDPTSRPAAAWDYLSRRFDLRPIDAIDADGLADSRLLLLAQPRALAPAELVALDDWVRGGGRALILTDPALVWPSALPLGDIRRPPAVGLLGPLLGHWGLTLRPGAPGTVATWLRSGGALRRLVLAAPGRLAADGEGCRVAADAHAAHCAVGRGAAWLLADADLLDHRLWAARGTDGGARHRRTADNMAVVADLLDRLAGVRRPAETVEWIAPGAPVAAAVAAAGLPLLLLLVIASRRARMMPRLIHSGASREQKTNITKNRP